jgi:hypothetical protein
MKRNPEGAKKSRLTELKTEGCPRGSPFTSSSSSSPNMSLDSTIVSTTQDFSFSIDRPPSMDVLDEQPLTIPYSSSLQSERQSPQTQSVSSMSTDKSANLQLSRSMTIPTSSNITLPGPGMPSPRLMPHEFLSVIRDDKGPSYDAPLNQHSSFGLRNLLPMLKA